jgi:hypothetical protein
MGGARERYGATNDPDGKSRRSFPKMVGNNAITDAVSPGEGSATTELALKQKEQKTPCA